VQTSKLEREAQAELDKLKDRKKLVGFAVERGGCRLANAKRRMGFLDDEDFEDVVGAEGETGSEAEGGADEVMEE
jgi:hypothetical protein